MNAKDTPNGNFQHFADMGADAFSAGDYSVAVKHYEAALARDPQPVTKKAAILQDLAVSYLSVGESEKGKSLLESALDLDPSNVDILKNYATALSLSGDTEKAKEITSRALLARVREEAGLVAADIKADLEIAPETVLERLDERQREREATELNDEAYELLRSGNHDRAREKLHAALDLNADHAAALGNLAASYMQQSKWTKAIPWLERALVVDPSGDNEIALALCKKELSDLQVKPELETSNRHGSTLDPEAVTPSSDSENVQPRRPAAVWLIFVWVVFSGVASLVSSYQFASSGAQLPAEFEMQSGTAQYILGVGLQLFAIVAAVLLILRIPTSRWVFAAVLSASTLAWAFTLLAGALPEQMLLSSIAAAVVSLGISALITWYTFVLVRKGYYNELKTMPELPPRQSKVHRGFLIAAAGVSVVLLIVFLVNFFTKRNNTIYIPGIVFAASNLALLYWHSRHQYMTLVHKVCISIAIGFPVFFVAYSAAWPYGAGQFVFWLFIVALPVILAAVLAFKATDDFLGFSPSPFLPGTCIVLAVACVFLNATELMDRALTSTNDLRSMRQLANFHGTIYVVTSIAWAMLIYSGLRYADRENVPATS